ncbi:MAG TPA: hypothetical protein VH683_11780 [Thermoleophilaceae bacterium]
MAKQDTSGSDPPLRLVLDEQERERSELAQQLRDRLAQSLAVVLFGLDSIERQKDEGASARLALMHDQLARALALCTELADGLRPSVLDELGVAPALESLAERSEVERVTVDPALAAVADGHETEVYRVVEEALRAAGVGSDLDVSVDPARRELCVSVRPAAGHAGLGELGRLRARVELAGGELADVPGGLGLRIPLTERNGAEPADFPQRRPVETPDGARHALP